MLQRANGHRGKATLAQATAGFYFPAHRLVDELDGWDTHRTKAAFKSDRRKDAALTSIVYRVMRFTYDDAVHEPDTVVARLRPRSAPA